MSMKMAKAAVADKVKKVTFTRTVVQDFENDKVTYGDATKTMIRPLMVTSPEIDNYTADKATAS